MPQLLQYFLKTVLVLSSTKVPTEFMMSPKRLVCKNINTYTRFLNRDFFYFQRIAIVQT